MSTAAETDPVKLAVSILAADRGLAAEVIKDLSGHFGKADFISEWLDFHYTDYYEREMGPGLARRLITFEDLVRPESLPDIKKITNGIEDRCREDGRRKVNIDPGYLNRCHFILATGKPYAHRPYLRDGVYADVTLVYRAGSFQSLEWTYPDYAGETLAGLLGMIREKYLLQLRELKNISDEGN